MSKTLFPLLVIAILLQANLKAIEDDRNQLVPVPLDITGSDTLEQNGARFVSLIQSEWCIPKQERRYSACLQIELQLQITNISKSRVMFERHANIRLYRTDGTEVAPLVHHKEKMATPAAILSPGASFSICPSLQIVAKSDSDGGDLVFKNGCNKEMTFQSLLPGNYCMVVEYEVSSSRHKTDSALVWTGKIATQKVMFNIAKARLRGGMPSEDTDLADGAPVSISESTPAKSNDAEFVIVASDCWRLIKTSEPIDIQLRISNTSSQSKIFPTFDSFKIVLKDGTGKKMEATGGRDATSYTRPIRIPPRTAYTISRKAEIRWNALSKTSELLYWDGTGWLSYFGPIRSGSYKIGFSYFPSADSQLDNEFSRFSKDRFWLGRIDTKEVKVVAND